MNVTSTMAALAVDNVGVASAPTAFVENDRSLDSVNGAAATATLQQYGSWRCSGVSTFKSPPPKGNFETGFNPAAQPVKRCFKATFRYARRAARRRHCSHSHMSARKLLELQWREHLQVSDHHLEGSSG
jgi:hypothetical protein